MSTDSQRAARPGPASPCINVCALDAQGHCTGCLRTADEIGRWMSMSAEEQWSLLGELERRRKHLSGGRR